MSKFRYRNLLLVLAVILAVILVAVILVRYEPETPVKMLAKTLPEGVDLTLSQIDYTHIEDGVARWRLQAEQVEHQSSQGYLGIRKPHLEIFNENGDLLGSLTSAQGEVTNDYEKVHIDGDVIVESPAGYTFYTDHAEYDQDRGLIVTDAAVRIVGEGLELTGKGMEIDVSTRHLKILSDVTMRYEPGKKL